MLFSLVFVSHHSGRTTPQAVPPRNLSVRRLPRPGWGGENSSSFRSSLIPRHSPLTTNSFTIRTSKTPLPQLLYNPHLQAPLGSAGNKGLITPLESALTENSPVTPVESALTKRWGWGRVRRNNRSRESQYAIGPAPFSTSAVSTMTAAPCGQPSGLKGAKVQRPLSLNCPLEQVAGCVPGPNLGRHGAISKIQVWRHYAQLQDPACGIGAGYGSASRTCTATANPERSDRQDCVAGAGAGAVTAPIFAPGGTLHPESPRGQGVGGRAGRRQILSWARRAGERRGA